MKALSKVAELPFQEIHSIPKLIKEYLNGDLDPYQDAVFQRNSISEKVNAKKEYFTAEKRQILSDAIKEQFSGLNLSVKQFVNLEALSSENTFTITTGHQLNLFSGPVFFVYKILQTIKLAEILTKDAPENHFVPVFWMATEDHDFEEINHFKTEHNFYEMKAKSGGAVGRIVIEDTNFISEFENEFKNDIFGTELILLMKKAYQKGRTLAEATRILVHELFSEFGLLIIDGDHQKLKSEMNTTFKNELLHQDLFETSKGDVAFLKEKYGKVQVNPREINLFYLSETRNRIEKKGSEFHIVDTNLKFSEDELLTELQNNPEKFSPNALLRPVYQESVLPNIAYIGGNAEVMYWLELKTYFEHLKLPFPFVIPRNSLLFLSEKTIRKIGKLDCTIHDFFEDFPQITKRFLLSESTIPEVLDKNEAEIKTSFQNLTNIASETDVSFRNMVQAEETRQLKSFERLRKRLLRAEKIKQQEKLERLENLFLEIHPGKNWQERTFNFSVFYADLGREWLQSCYEEMDVEKSQLIIFSV